MMTTTTQKRVGKLGEHHDLYMQNDTVLLADVFESFRSKCNEICQFDPAQFFISNRISMTSMI